MVMKIKVITIYLRGWSYFYNSGDNIFCHNILIMTIIIYNHFNNCFVMIYLKYYDKNKSCHIKLKKTDLF